MPTVSMIRRPPCSSHAPSRRRAAQCPEAHIDGCFRVAGGFRLGAGARGTGELARENHTSQRRMSSATFAPLAPRIGARLGGDAPDSRCGRCDSRQVDVERAQLLRDHRHRSEREHDHVRRSRSSKPPRSGRRGPDPSSPRSRRCRAGPRRRARGRRCPRSSPRRFGGNASRIVSA